MEEKQTKQLEIIKKALQANRGAVCDIHRDIVGLAQFILKDVTAYEVISGKSELMLAASALMSLAAQVEQIIPDSNE